MSVSKIAYLMEKVFELLRGGTIEPASPMTLYDYSDFITGFRAMHDGNHMGKIVFEVTPKSTVSVAVPRTRDTLNLDPRGAYVIVGGLGGLGRGMASYLAERGAKYLVLLSRSGAATQESQQLLERLRSSGVTVEAHACDIADRERLATVLSEINEKMPPIKGVIQSAMVLRDSMFENMTWENWLAATRPKIQGSWNLHQLMPKDLDFFVMLSSSTAIIGNRGQANYCAGNTFQDALAHHRKSIGLPAVSLDLGAIRGIGWVAENSDTNILKAMDRIIVEQRHFYSVLRSAITGHTYGSHETPTQLITAAGSGVSGSPTHFETCHLRKVG
jgi:NAD(P)-dependent dehydrogenase (short-subunit alcohol dehydrogenase family)